MPLVAPPSPVAKVVEFYVPGVWLWMNQTLQRTMAGIPGVKFVNWYRDPAHNRRVGGAPDSQHQAGLAIDFVFTSSTKRTAIGRLKAAGLQVLDEGDHVHVQVFPATTGRQLLAILRQHGVA